MKFFIDSANLEEIKQVAEMGLVDGVTTNPSLLAKEGKGFKTTIQEICSIVDGPVSAEVVTSDKAEQMLKEAHIVSSWHPNVVVKIPFGPEGMKVVKKLTEEGIKTNVTLLFSVPQALIAAKAGATFSPILSVVSMIWVARAWSRSGTRSTWSTSMSSTPRCWWHRSAPPRPLSRPSAPERRSLPFPSRSWKCFTSTL
jgi:transaldolase